MHLAGRTSEQTGSHDTSRTPATGCFRPPITVQAGTILHRSVCITNEHPATSILQLVPRPRSPQSGCTLLTMGEPSRLHVPTVFLDHTLLGETPLRASPVWHNQLWYAPLLRSFPILLPPAHTILIGPVRYHDHSYIKSK